MAWTNVGFDGTINEAQWASLAGLLGNGYVAAGNGDCLATAVPGARSVSVAAGSLYGDGILSTNSAPETVAMTTPVNGQWYVIALRRTWATNTAALVAIAGATTTTTTPTAPPTSFPTLNTNVGVLTDQPIAWAWCNSANTTVVVYDIRLKAVKSLPPVVANANERDAKFMTPSQGLQVWRDDLGVVETYLNLYDATTNPGGGVVAGWTSTPRQFGLVPVRPTSVVIGSGSGSANALGQITFTNASSILLNGVFNSSFRNYRIILTVNNVSTNTDISARCANGGTVDSGAAYLYNFAYSYGTSAINTWNNGASSATRINFCATQNVAGATTVTCDVLTPAIATRTVIPVTSTAWNGAYNMTSGAAWYANEISHDGIQFFPTAGTMNGTIQVFGYND